MEVSASNPVAIIAQLNWYVITSLKGGLVEVGVRELEDGLSACTRELVVAHLTPAPVFLLLLPFQD